MKIMHIPGPATETCLERNSTAHFVLAAFSGSTFLQTEARRQKGIQPAVIATVKHDETDRSRVFNTSLQPGRGRAPPTRHRELPQLARAAAAGELQKPRGSTAPLQLIYRHGRCQDRTDTPETTDTSETRTRREVRRMSAESVLECSAAV